MLKAAIALNVHNYSMNIGHQENTILTCKVPETCLQRDLRRDTVLQNDLIAGTIFVEANLNWTSLVFYSFNTVLHYSISIVYEF